MYFIKSKVSPSGSHIKEVCYQGLKENVTTTNENLEVNLYKFISLLSASTAESFKVHQITQNCAALFWTLRAAIFEKFMSSEINEKELDLVKKNQRNPFSKVCQIYDLAKRNVGTKISNMIWDEDILYVNNIPYTREDLVEMVGQATLDLENILKKLMFGKKLPSISITDDIHNEEIGYGFMKFKISSDLRFCLMDNLQISQNDKIDAEQALSYLKLVDEFVFILLGLFHICGGIPSRSTELATVSLTNSRFKRNIFFIGKSLIFAQTYNKTNNLTKREKIIPHFLPQKLTSIISIYLVCVIPVVMIFAESVFTQETAILYKTSLFIINGKKLCAEKIRLLFGQFTFKFMGKWFILLTTV